MLLPGYGFIRSTRDGSASTVICRFRCSVARYSKPERPVARRGLGSYVQLAPKIFSARVPGCSSSIPRAGYRTANSHPPGIYDAIRVYLWAGMSGGATKNWSRCSKIYPS